MMKLIIPAMMSTLMMSGCVAIIDVPAPALYSDPAQSGLRAVRPYPAAEDVCQVIGENAVVSDYLDDAALLVGCPKSEAGAIADRRAEGGVIVGDAQDWVLISIPLR